MYGQRSWRERLKSKVKRGRETASKSSSPATLPELSTVTGAEAEPAQPPEISEQEAEAYKSLWDRAYDDLREEQSVLVQAFEEILMSDFELESTELAPDGDATKREVQMSALVEKKLAAMNGRQWRVWHKSATVREQVDQIVKVVLVAKDFVSSVTAIDPIHAGLPWAGVCVVLSLLVKDSKQHNAAIDGLKDVSILVRRYAEIERIYLRREKLHLEISLEAAMRKLYSHILEYEARAACQFNRNTALRIARNILEADSWENILENVKKSEADCDRIMQQIEARDQRESAAQLKGILDEQDRKVDELLQKSRMQESDLLAEARAMRKDQKVYFETKEETECHKTFRNTAYETTMEKNPDRVQGTCEWFLRHPNYNKWLDEPTSDLLWVTADPGCGKSVLSKFLYDDYSSWMWKDTSICYFFFKDDSDENKSATHALSAILHQLFKQNQALIKHAIPEYNSNGNMLPQLFSTLWGILLKAAADPKSDGIVCILDALDECSESSREQLIKYVAEFHSTKNKTAKLKFLITSRPYDSIKRCFSQYFSRGNQDLASIKLMGEGEHQVEEIRVEIDLVIDKRVKDFREERSREGVDDNAHVAIQEQLKKIENRTYLWMTLVFHEIMKMVGYAEDALLEEIRHIPPTVYDAYERILAKSRDKDKARKLLHIICAAARPLTLAEMNRALSMNDGGRPASLTPSKSFPNVVRELCGLFVNIRDSKIYLIHQTAKEFLVRGSSSRESARPLDSKEAMWRHSLEPTESNLVLAKICISYLLSAEFGSHHLVTEESDSDSDGTDSYIMDASIEKAVYEYCKKYDLLLYAAKFWVNHFREAKIKEDSPVLHSAVRACDIRTGRLLAWFQVYWTIITNYSGRCPQELTDLMLGSFLGLEAVVRFLIQKGTNVDSRDNGGRTSLWWAVVNRNLEVAQLLLEKGAHVDSKNEDGWTPLMAATHNGNLEVTQVLLENGANVESKNEKGHTPLLLATYNGHLEIVQLLLEKGVDVNTKDKESWTPLSSATRNGHLKVIQLLLEYGANVNSTAEEGWTPLSLAARKGYFKSSQLLLEKGACVDFKDEKGRTPLGWATASGYLRVAQLLLDKGANADSRDEMGYTPLWWAIMNGRSDAAQLLLENGVNVDFKDEKGQTPLWWAIRNGQLEVAQLLLENGANAEFKDEKGHTPLGWATANGYLWVAQLLLDKGANADSRDEIGYTPLWWAIMNGRLDITQLLLENGANADFKDEKGHTPLWWATQEGHLETTQLLLENGANADFKDKDCRAWLIDVSKDATQT